MSKKDFFNIANVAAYLVLVNGDCSFIKKGIK